MAKIAKARKSKLACRFGKVMKNRYTTDSVQSALSDYVAACAKACQDVSSILVQLSETLYDDGHMPAVVQASYANLILASAFHQAVQANSLGWNLAVTYETANDVAGEFVGV